MYSIFLSLFHLRECFVMLKKDSGCYLHPGPFWKATSLYSSLQSTKNHCYHCRQGMVDSYKFIESDEKWFVIILLTERIKKFVNTNGDIKKQQTIILSTWRLWKMRNVIVGYLKSTTTNMTTGISITLPHVHWKWVHPMVYNFIWTTTQIDTIDTLQFGQIRRAT